MKSSRLPRLLKETKWPPTMGRLSLAVLKALTYSDLFDYPLTLDEIHKFTPHKAGKAEVQKTLRLLKNETLVAKRQGYWVLRGREEITTLRSKRNIESQRKLAIAKKAVRIISILPSVQFVGISGSLSCLNAKKNDDIDFFVITKPSTVWLTRFLTTTLLDLANKRRRRGDSQVKDKICLNMFVAEDALEFKKGDLYLAREIAQLKPLYDRNGAYRALIERNSWWLNGFLPNFRPNPPIGWKKPLKNGHSHAKSPLAVFETFSRMMQIKYMGGKVKKEILDEERIFFHPEDVHYRILDKYNRRVRNLNS